MALFEKKPPCPICGGKISWLLPTKIEGEYICNECSSKLDMEAGIRSQLTMQGLHAYMAFYEDNQALKANFVVSEKLDFGFFDTKLIFDLEHNLFCLSGNLDKTVFEGQALRSFRILEDNTTILQGSKQGLVRHVSTVPERVAAMAPQFQMMVAARRMAIQMERMANNDNRQSYRPPMDISEPFREFRVELNFEHPYWTVFQYDMSGPTFNNDYPNAADYLREYHRGVEVMEQLASLLMKVAFPGAGEITAAGASASIHAPSAERTADDIMKFKSLLDAGIITQAEFDLKKKQLLGI
ncbi:MAG TPA: DUF4428 domain-containing protein [Clostridia bacterium]|nr:DUF4428 domain-containing protein [Clostridia bacterium]